ncbi:MAG: cytochrome c3 family protein [Bacteroidetes bacterium]|nr:cytochrome c3 family protein [Bacteroidota bacterium]
MGNRVPSQKIGPFWRCLLALFAAMSVNVLVSAVSATPVAAELVEGSSTVSGFPSVSSQSCLDCHKQPDLEMSLPDGDKLSLYVDGASMIGSVHSGKLNCTDCHSEITGFPHKKLQVSSKRDYSIAEYEVCKRCHFANYTKTVDSIHYQVLQSGNKTAPLCTDCHGFHDVTNPTQPRSKISQACGACHKDVYDQYIQSVHGAALTNGNPDVPVCTDCHGAHNIQQADTASFRLNSPDMCGKCHSDAAKMSKYSLSPNVYDTYMKDFHGVTVSLTKEQGPGNLAAEAVCSDCHGVHDIKSTKGGNIAQLKQNMVTTCRKCHPDAGTNFPDAWMHHYELSLAQTPLPWLVRAFYWVMVPFMLGGLFLHMIVDLWRIARNR